MRVKTAVVDRWSTPAEKATAARLVMVLASLVVVGALVVTGSRAAFTADTENTGNTWETPAEITLTDDDDGAAMFTVNDMRPDETEVECIAITYQGTLSADITLAVTASGDLAQYLNVTVERGTGGDFESCAGFGSATAVAGPVKLSALGAALEAADPWVATNASSGVTRTYRFTVTVDSDNAAQGKSATAAFLWEAETN